MFDAFTEQARNAIIRAQHAASDMGDEAVQMEHLLLGLFSHEDDIASKVLADFGLTMQVARDMVQERLCVDPDSAAEGQLPPFSPTAKDALGAAYRLGMGEPGTEHILIVLVARGEGGASEILRALGTDPNRIRSETKKRAWPPSVPGPGAGARNEVRETIHKGRLDELDFGS